MKSLFVLVVILLSACGGTPKDGATTPDGKGSAGKAGAAAGDVSLDIPTIEIKGNVFEPEALGRPGMPIAQSKIKNITLPVMIKRYQAEKDITQKQAHASVIATMLYEQSKTAQGAQQKQLLTDARQYLRDVAQQAGPKNIDETTLRMLGAYEVTLEDWPAAEKAWEGLVTKLPKDKDVGENRAWWVYSLIQQGKTDAAIALIKSDTPDAKQPLLAYMIAWAKWRAHDDNGAWSAITAALAGWGANGNKEVVDRDAFFFAARSKQTPDQVKQQLFTLFKANQPGLQYEVLVKLGERNYQFAGRWQDAVNTLEEAVKIAGATIPAPDKVRVKYNIAQMTVPLDQPTAAAAAAKDSIQALPACTACKPEEKEALVTQIYGIARTFHLLYATANDIRFYQPAHDLYDLTIPLMQNTANRTQAKNDVGILEKTLKNTKVGTGTHEKQAIGVLLGRHNQEIQVCYEEGLAANPKLAGQLVLELESDATGAIKGASSEPKAGAADMSAVATCAIAAAKTWKLPKRGMAGSTRIKLTYAMSKK